jgi:hypothetical protein
MVPLFPDGPFARPAPSLTTTPQPGVTCRRNGHLHILDTPRHDLASEWRQAEGSILVVGGTKQACRTRGVDPAFDSFQIVVPEESGG